MTTTYTKDYQDITMSDIAKKAEVARMTLYRHFSDKEEMIKKVTSIISAIKSK